MTRIKLCGLKRTQDIEKANELKPDYVGFVFYQKSRRAVLDGEAEALRELLDPSIESVGVFVNEPEGHVAQLLNRGIIQIAQLHGTEDLAYIQNLRQLTDGPVWKAFAMDSNENAFFAQQSSADMVLLDSAGGGTGTVFQWELLNQISRPYFLAGGLTPENVKDAVKMLDPYGVDVSSGIETNGKKDPKKMEAFVWAVRKESGALLGKR
ncbi:MAG: phosphoribosylanthranilate isomerase [Lachnospiraceae bacterium]|nr:phosphoribosylanthranilate isomerase [Lachnospiraceae bacterium]